MQENESMLRVERTSALGRIGESLAEQALRKNGFSNIRNLNRLRHNQPYADLIAEKNGQRYFIGVKARNETRDCGLLNESYNCILVETKVNKKLKGQGKSVQEITEMALQKVAEMAADYQAIPAWITVPIRAEQGTYAVYFGLLSDLGCKRCVPMKLRARKNYCCLIDWEEDEKITPDLTNRRR